MNALIDAATDAPLSVWIALVGPVLVALIGGGALVWSTWHQTTKADEREGKIRAAADARAKEEASRVDRQREADRQHQLALAEQQYRRDLRLAWRAERVTAYRDFRSVAMDMRGVLRNNHGALDNMSIEDMKEIDPALVDRLRDSRSEVMLVGGEEVAEACDKAATALLKEDVLYLRRRLRDHRRDGVSEPSKDPMIKVEAAIKHFTETARRELGITELQIDEPDDLSPEAPPGREERG